MSKLKVYLDTSVVSYLEQEDAPEKMLITRRLWQRFIDGDYDIFLSSLTLKEVRACSEPKRSKLLHRLDLINFFTIKISKEVFVIANQIIGSGILTKKSYYDSCHIGAAVFAKCDCILSWNFKHLVNINTIRGVRAITDCYGLKQIDIVSPMVFLESDEV